MVGYLSSGLLDVTGPVAPFQTRRFALWFSVRLAPKPRSAMHRVEAAAAAGAVPGTEALALALAPSDPPLPGLAEEIQDVLVNDVLRTMSDSNFS